MKTSPSCEKTVPLQKTGEQHNTEHTISLPTVQACVQRYNIAKDRLLEVNHWGELGGPFSANFTLTDGSGHVVHHKAREGDHIRIDLPGPGSKTGNGYDWVEIEKIEDRCTSSGNSAYVAIRVRPSGNPRDFNSRIAHFFAPTATSSFVVERVGNRIKASVYGRNEKPNKEHQEGLLDRLRNVVVAVSATLGFSKPQWQGLVKGLLKN
ncbi:hypothetical protein F0L74_26590 [Chitinophaga agrisoli]|uniref:Uncharacterized protein n=1 Tax=Chitinophaga agrisoli TaxID=2607653 RepID=A0A5B2VN75_9BACT|nr:hypothetical protein [Chitinophaga agrisoli]KAA2239762.1 hypothetical protein F0L74_26590 [Chitinophaga agrisoli]